MKMYQVGGFVRDEILGIPSKDVDFSVILTDVERRLCEEDNIPPFDFMSDTLRGMGFKIFLETPEFLTVRAQFPKHIISDSGFVSTTPNLTADFVLARKESDYTDGRRPDIVEPGSLLDDLSRRDFTMNAVAKDENGNYIDPFGGRSDIAHGIIRAVGDPFERLTEDALRAVRAIRFSVTKGFIIDSSLDWAMRSIAVQEAIATKISDERIKDELSKMFRFDTVKSLIALYKYPGLTGAMFSGSVSLDSTMKTKGRGK